MHILYMLVIGLVIGALAKAAMPGRDPGGIFITILLGITGSLLAGFIALTSVAAITPYAIYRPTRDRSEFLAGFINSFPMGPRGRRPSIYRRKKWHPNVSLFVLRWWDARAMS